MTHRLRTALGRPETRWRGGVYGSHAVLHVPAADERVWSPFLSLDFRWDAGQTHVQGRYGPKPSVWSLFVAGYILWACVGFFALVFGWSQWWIGQSPWAFAGLPVAALGALLVHGLAPYGQRRGQAQMTALRRFLDDTLDPPAEPPA